GRLVQFSGTSHVFAIQATSPQSDVSIRGARLFVCKIHVYTLGLRNSAAADQICGFAVPTAKRGCAVPCHKDVPLRVKLALSSSSVRADPKQCEDRYDNAGQHTKLERLPHDQQSKSTSVLMRD